MNTESLTQCSSYFSSTFVSIWNRRSKTKKLHKKKGTVTLRCDLIGKKQFPRFPSFWFRPIPKIENSEISESFILLKLLVEYETQNDLKEKNFNFTMWFEKKKCSFPRFSSFRFCPILEIENLETSESFRLLQIFIVSVALNMGKIKTFHWISN